MSGVSQALLGRMAALMIAPESRRRAFVAGFNGRTATAVTASNRRDWQTGRDAAVALGYIKDGAT